MRSPPSACLVHDKVLTEDKILMKQRDQSCRLIQNWTADKYIQFLKCTAAKMASLKPTEVNVRFKHHFQFKKTV